MISVSKLGSAFRRCSALALCVAASETLAVAQFNCSDPQLTPFDASSSRYPGSIPLQFSSNVIRVIAPWDPDGPGPASSKFAVGGIFGLVGDAVASCIAAYDPETDHWSALGSGVNNSVMAIAQFDNGDLVAGGNFTVAGGTPAKWVARWNSTLSAWQPLGSGLDGGVAAATYALTTLPNGDLIAGGNFATAGGVNAKGIARWSVSTNTWSALGSGLTNGAGGEVTVLALKTLANGDVIVGGGFITAGGVSALRIARWSGATWSPLGAGLDYVPRALAFHPNGDLIVAGDSLISSFPYVSRLSRWNGVSWTFFGTELTGGIFNNPSVYGLATLPNGDVIAAGEFTGAGATTANRVARWDAAAGAWTPFGSGTSSTVFALATTPKSDLLAAGQFGTAGGLASSRIARWNGSAWAPVSPSMNSGVFALSAAPNGDVVAGGWSTKDGGSEAQKVISRWESATGTWSTLGSGMSGTNCGIYALEHVPGGDVVAGGHFISAGGTPANHIARWDSSIAAWTPLGTGMTTDCSGACNGPAVLALARLASGDLVAGGGFKYAGGLSVSNIARWDGSAWFPLGSGISGADGVVRTLLLLPTGDLIVGGGFTFASGTPASGIARWNGSIWSPLGAGILPGPAAGVFALAVLPNGHIIAGGDFYTAGGGSAKHIARWDGQSWSSLAGGSDYRVLSLAALSNGDFVAGGDFSTAGGVTANRIALWRESTGQWNPIGAGFAGYFNGYGGVYALSTLPSGNLAAGGFFTHTSDAVVTPFIALVGCPTNPPCYADCDQSGSLDIDDFICFQTLFAVGSTSADCDASGSLDIDDFICFQTAFAIGC